MPDSVMVPVPTLTSEPPAPRITPLTSVERLLLPTVSWFGPREKVPAPSMERAVIPPLDREVSANGTQPGVKRRALPPVALSTNAVRPPALVIMMALPALLPLRKKMFAWLPMIKVGALDELLTMPVPVILIDVEKPFSVVKL